MHFEMQYLKKELNILTSALDKKMCITLHSHNAVSPLEPLQ